MNIQVRRSGTSVLMNISHFSADGAQVLLDAVLKYDAILKGK
jgi:hypothetical protein